MSGRGAPLRRRNLLRYIEELCWKTGARCGIISFAGFKTHHCRCIDMIPVAQLDRALDSDSKGQRFESSRVHHLNDGRNLNSFVRLRPFVSLKSISCRAF